MSTGPGTPPTEIPAASQAVLQQIGELALKPQSIEAFFADLLPRAISATGTAAGGIWMIDAQRRLVLAREQELLKTGFMNDPMLKAAFEQPFSTAVDKGCALAFATREEKLDGPGRMFSMLLGGVWAQQRPQGLVQLLEEEPADPNARGWRLAALEQICQSISTFLSRLPTFPTGTSSTNPAAPGGTAPRPSPQIPTLPGGAANVSSTAPPMGGFVPGVPFPVPPQAGGPVRPAPNPGPAPSAGGPPVPLEVLPAGTVVGGAAATPVTPTDLPLEEVLAVHNHLRVNDVAQVAANDGRRWLGVDRVSIAERVGNRLRLMSISGSQSVNPRSNVVQLLSDLADKVVRSGERLTFDGESRTLPPLLEQPLADYLHESRSRAVVIAPLFDPVALKKFTDAGIRGEKEPVPKPKPLGALVVEQISDTPLPRDLDQRLDCLTAHTGLAMRNAQEHERIFLMPLWRFLGGYTSWFRGRRLAQWALGLAAAAGVAAALTYLRWDYRAEGKGRLMPVIRQEVFAPWDGDVIQVKVSTGDPVKQGDTLLVLKNDELQARLLAQQNALAEKETQVASVRSQLSESTAGLTRAQINELQFKEQQLLAEIKGVELQVGTLEKQIGALTVKATIDGVVATFRVEELLRQRPVRRGELLLQVMDPSKDWRLELDVAENRLGHMLEAQSQSGTRQLPLTYILATGTEKTWQATLDTIGSRAMVSEKEGAVIPVFATPTAPLPDDPQIGAEVIAKINCGKKPLGYVLFGDVIEFFRKKLWF
ncbi:MAG TPA: hypothetical protein DDY91_19325 [Planctomycetaceae bacterium]|nr:hypothetical protein [Planctomycetaceae bacterium]